MPSLCSARPTEPILHIAYATEACPPEVDGATLAVARALRPLRAAGHRVQWVRPRQRGESALCCAVEGRSTGAGATTATATTKAATTDTTDTTAATLLRPA